MPSLVWVSGPLYLGLYNDIQIFCQGLIYILDDGERIEADKGYTGEHPMYCKIPTGVDRNDD